MLKVLIFGMLVSFLSLAAHASQNCPYTIDQSTDYFKGRFGDNPPVGDTVQYLEMENRGFENKDLPYLCSLQALSTLKIYNDGAPEKGALTGVNLDVLAPLVNLKSLDLDGNRIHATELGKLQGLKNLRVLEIGYGNPLGSEGMEQLDLLPQLVELHLRKNNVGPQDLAWLKKSNKEWNVLNFTENENFGPAVAALGDAKAREIRLNSCGLNSSDGFENLAGNTYLNVLNLGSNPLDDEAIAGIAEKLSPNKNLRELHFEAEMIGETAAVAIGRMPYLQVTSVGADFEKPEQSLPIAQALLAGSLKEVIFVSRSLDLLSFCKYLQPKFPDKKISVVVSRSIDCKKIIQNQ